MKAVSATVRPPIPEEHEFQWGYVVELDDESWSLGSRETKQEATEACYEAGVPRTATWKVKPSGELEWVGVTS